MANLAIRTDNKMTKAPTQTGDWTPARLLRDLLGWDPFREMEPYLTAEDRAFQPRFEVLENKDAYVFKADLPGVKDSDINITLTGNRLVIAGRRENKQEQQSSTFYVYEVSYGDFSRAFTLPDGADTEHMNANLSDGVLTIIVPKKPGAQSKQIPVNPSQNPSQARA